MIPQQWQQHPYFLKYQNTATDIYAQEYIKQSLDVPNDSYLSDNAQLIESYLRPNKFNVIVSDTGMGKSTYAIKHLLKNPKYKSPVLVMPLTSIKDEFLAKLSQDTDLTINTELEDSDLIILSNPSNTKRITICTYHHLAKNYKKLLIKPDLIVWDEVHWLTAYHWSEDLTAALHKIIRDIVYTSPSTTMIGLTATPGPLIFFSKWFFIHNILTIKTQLKVPPKEIILYKVNGLYINKVDIIKHYIHTHIEQLKAGEKMLIISEKFNQHKAKLDTAQDLLNHGLETACYGNTQFHNLEKSLISFNTKKHYDLNLEFVKSADKLDSLNIQTIMKEERLNDGTDILITTIFLSNGVNIHDSRVKHVMVLSDKIDLIKQSAARLRIPNNANLIAVHRTGDIPEKIQNSLPRIDEMNDYLEFKTTQKYTLDENSPNFYTLVDGEWIFNPSTPIGRWYDYFQQILFQDSETMFDIVYPDIKLTVVNEELFGLKLFKGNLRKLKGLSGFDGIDGVSNESIQMAYGIELVETKEEEKMYKGCKKSTFENCMKKLGLEYKDIEFEKIADKNRNYIFKLIKILK